MGLFGAKLSIPTPSEALPGREAALRISGIHAVTGRSLKEIPPGHQEVLFAMGCFWGAERKFWSLDGVHSTSVGYAGGSTKNPTYEEVCSGMTGHTEVVRVVYDPQRISIEQLLRVFWESHDPTQGMRQGNDRGTQYRSAIYTSTDAQLQAAKASLQAYEQRLGEAGFEKITTELKSSVPFYFAEEYHQQYLAKNPNGYCGLGGTGVSCA